MVRVFILDNYDSFTFNLAQAFMKLGADVRVERGGTVAFEPTHIVLSPGPLRPSDHPANFALLNAYAGRLPILGVCLGMQAINEWCGGTLRRDTPPMHGKTSEIRYETGSPLFDGLPNPLTVARYHSLVVDRLGSGLRADAWVGETVMAVTHESLPIYGVQFHPESYLTPDGEKILGNFLHQ